VRTNNLDGGWSLNPPNPKIRCWKCDKYRVSKEMNELNNYCLDCYKEMKV